MFLALSLADVSARPVDLPAAEVAAIAREFDDLRDSVLRRGNCCALCRRPILPTDAVDMTGIAHAGCSDIELADEWDECFGHRPPTDAEIEDMAAAAVAEAF